MRPAFNEITSFEQFERYYWYRSELACICKSPGLSSSGNKTELNEAIRLYFEGEDHSATPTHRRARRPTKATVPFDEITPDTPLLDCGFAFNKKFKTLMAGMLGVPADTFHCTADMAAAWKRPNENTTGR